MESSFEGRVDVEPFLAVAYLLLDFGDTRNVQGGEEPQNFGTDTFGCYLAALSTEGHEYYLSMDELVEIAKSVRANLIITRLQGQRYKVVGQTLRGVGETAVLVMRGGRRGHFDRLCNARLLDEVKELQRQQEEDIRRRAEEVEAEQREEARRKQAEKCDAERERKKMHAEEQDTRTRMKMVERGNSDDLHSADDSNNARSVNRISFEPLSDGESETSVAPGPTPSGDGYGIAASTELSTGKEKDNTDGLCKADDANTARGVKRMSFGPLSDGESEMSVAPGLTSSGDDDGIAASTELSIGKEQDDSSDLRAGYSNKAGDVERISFEALSDGESEK